MWSNSHWPNYWGDVYWPPLAEEVVAIDPCPAFRLFKRDCEMQIKGWGDVGAYQQISPFGGPHHEEPSGAEI